MASNTQGSSAHSELYRPQFRVDWDSHLLYDLADWVNGMAFKNIQFSPSGRPVIKIAEIKNGISGQTKFTENEYDHAYLIADGDMLFSWSGQPETSIDVFRWRGSTGWLNQHIFKVHPKDKCRESYFFYLLKYLNPTFVRIARNKQTTGLGHVTKKDLQSITVRIPPDENVQRAIAHILGSLDDKIELNQQMNRTLEKMGQAIFKSWFIDFDPVHAKAEGRDTGLPKEIADLFPDSLNENDGDLFPQGWPPVPLEKIIEVNPRRALKKGCVATYLDMKNMPTRGMRPADWWDREFKSGSRFSNGDTLVARITPCLENGKTAFVNFLVGDEIGWGSTEYIVLRSKYPLPDEFTYFLARNKHFRRHAIANMTGSSGRQRVPATAIKNFIMTRATESVCLEFTKHVQPIIGRIKEQDDESRTLKKLRDNLLPKLISGELPIPDAERILEGVE